MPQKSANHIAAYRVRFVIDPDASFEECNGEARPLTEEEYRGNEYQQNGRDVSYAEYRRYYGDPDRHVYVQCGVETQCACCSRWSYATGTGGIDLMDDSPEVAMIDRTLTPDQIVSEVQALGYLREVAIEDLIEAGWKAPRSIYCAHTVKGKHCRYHAVAGSHYCAQHQTITVRS